MQRLVPDALLWVQNLRTQFATEDGTVLAVDGVTFDIARGDVFAVVGESGSGKSVMAMSILGLVPSPPGNVVGGKILWKGRDLLKVDAEEMRHIRGNEIAMVFQDPMMSFNPVHSIGRQIAEVARIHRGLGRRAARDRAIEVLDMVGIPRPQRRVDDYPHEFSGGMRQRAMIAMAIVCEPDLLIADEPTTALDVTVQAQVLEVLLEIKDRINSAIMLITHDLGVVAGVADRVMVMYAGQPVEFGSIDEIFYQSRHPYTLGLLGSLPKLDDEPDERLRPIGGQPPSLLHRPSGCAFHPRCPYAQLPAPCATDLPTMHHVGGAGHPSSCHFAERIVMEPPRPA
jgi:oligopeptide transport system ATP-binding protein